MNDQSKDNRKTSIIDTTQGRAANQGRRRFLAHGGMYSAGLVGSALLGACSSGHNVGAADNNSNGTAIGGPPDEAILNFALNLEYLEAEYYLRAVTGNGLMDQDRGDNPGTITGGTQVNFQTTLLRNYAREITADELHHVQFLRSALGGSAASEPDIDLQNSFATLGSALGVNGFNPFADEASFLLGAFIFEDVGVTAYKGGSPFIKSRAYLEAAAGILAVEAYHAGLLRTVLTSLADNPVGSTGFTVSQVVDAISDFRDSVDGNTDSDPDYTNGVPTIRKDDDQGIGQRNMVAIYGTNYDASNIVPVDRNSIAYSRSIAQVHNVVYGTASQASSGAFFPNGTNIPGYPELSMSGANG